jgi:hypothetical protein
MQPARLHLRKPAAAVRCDPPQQRLHITTVVRCRK